MSAVEATYSRIDRKLDNIGAGVRISQDCNYRICQELNAQREARGEAKNELLAEAAERGREWSQEPS